MLTAVDQVLGGKKRKINAPFEAMTGRYLFEPEFCNVASVWEKGIVEKNVSDRRTSIWHRAKDRRWADLAELNAWLAEQSKAAWAELNQPAYTAMKVADVLQDEQTQLMPVPRPFDCYVELLARVSSTSLIHLERNRYSVPTDRSCSRSESPESRMRRRLCGKMLDAQQTGQDTRLHLGQDHPRLGQHYLKVVRRHQFEFSAHGGAMQHGDDGSVGIFKSGVRAVETGGR
jgi:hypothetical protein